ncbi:MAG: signal recognition particle receptor subunit alpha [Nanoarchaeota archaeon]
MLDQLSSAIKNGFDKIANSIFLDKNTINSITKDLQRALIQADVNVHLVKEIGDKIKKGAENEKIKGIERKEHLTKILHDEILKLLGENKHELIINKNKKTKIMLVGLYGSGKTTTTGKLASYFSKRGLKTAMISLDVYRPAAMDQLEQLAKQIRVPVFTDKKEKDPIKIYKKFEKELENFDLILIDTAGRHSLDKDLIKEIKELTDEIKPDYKILIIQADIGQAAKNQSSEFKQACNINGVIITRMDSTAKAGGAITACKETNAPVFFIGTGEKINEIETFNPQSFISRLLGLGDLEGLLEKVQSAIDEKSQKKLETKLKEGNLDLKDFQEQLKQMSNIGSFSKITSMIPGFGKAKIPEGMMDIQEDKIKKWQNAINSMTIQEIKNPEIMEKQTSRLNRIAKGSGTTTTEIRQLLKQYKMIKDLSSGIDISDENQMLSQKQIQKLAKKYGKKIRL